MTWPVHSVENLVTTMRHACRQDKTRNTSSTVNFARLAAGQPWTTEQAIREEFLRQEREESLTPVTEAGVDE